jgi:methyltransferase (TIGR00027 family)
MREGRASNTARAVAFFRGVASHEGSPFGVRDPFAAHLVDGALAPLLAAAGRSRLLSRVLRHASLGLFDHLALRTLAIDAAVERAVARGARSLVVLGAGLDARAYRMACLDDTVAFEVDFPATQREKRARLGGARPMAREVRFVSVDFERDSLEERLVASGHEADAPTAWIWEGVTPYLDVRAVLATLDVVDRRSAPGSTLAVSYVTPDLARIEPTRARSIALPKIVEPALAAAFSVLGEPIRCVLAPREMAAHLDARGFRVEEDEGSRGWAGRHAAGVALSPFVVAERVAVAEKRG